MAPKIHNNNKHTISHNIGIHSSIIQAKQAPRNEEMMKHAQCYSNSGSMVCKRTWSTKQPSKACNYVSKTHKDNKQSISPNIGIHPIQWQAKQTQKQNNLKEIASATVKPKIFGKSFA